MSKIKNQSDFEKKVGEFRKKREERETEASRLEKAKEILKD
jgi:hypothetical protein